VQLAGAGHGAPTTHPDEFRRELIDALPGRPGG
jgi:hypothetical protein